MLSIPKNNEDHLCWFVFFLIFILYWEKLYLCFLVSKMFSLQIALAATKNLDKNWQIFLLRAKAEKMERVKFWEPEKRLVWGR